MADQTQPVYSWRPTGSQQGSNYFGAPQSFGQALNGGVAAAGGASSPFQTPPQGGQGGGFNVPGGNSAGFDSPAFSAASAPAPAGGTAPPPQSFGDALRTNPLSQPFPTSGNPAADAATHAAMQDLQPNQGPSMSSMFALNEENKGEAEALRKAQESSALNGRAFTGQIAGDTADTLAQKIIPQRQNFLGQLQGQEQQQELAKRQAAEGVLTGLGGQTNQAQIAAAGNKTAETVANIGATASVTNNQLSNATQKYISDNGLALDSKKLDAQIQQFTSNQDFQKWATQAGIDAQTAHDMWQGNQNDIQRKFDAGQQLTANEQQVRMEGLQEAHDTAMADLNHTLNLDTIDKQTASAATLKTMDQTFQSYMSDKGFGQTQALEATKQDYALALQKQGYDEQTSLQAADQYFKGTQAQLDRDQAKTLSEAQMAQQYDFFNQDLQQKYAFKDADVQIAKDQLDQHAQEFAQSMGLDAAKFDYLKKSDAFTQLSGTVSTLMAMAGDNKDMQQFAAETFYKGLGNITGADGKPIMPADQVSSGLLALKASSFTDPKTFSSWASSQKNADGTPTYTADQIQKATDSLGSSTTPKAGMDTFSALVDKNAKISNPDDAQALKDYATKVTNTYASAPAGKMIGSVNKNVQGADIDAAVANLRAAGVDQATLDKIVSRSKEAPSIDNGFQAGPASYDATPEMVNYTLYTSMINKGMDPASAASGLTALVGADKAKAALALDPSYKGGA